MAKDYTNQHIVPKRYLDRFGKKDGKRTIIGTRIVSKGNVRFFEDSTANVGYIKNYYDVTDKNDPKYWEHYFAREIDALCGQDMENIIAQVTLSPKNATVLSDQDKEVLSKIIVAQLMRIPESIVTPLPIAKQAIVQGNPIQELASSQHNMLMQQQVANLADMLQDTYKVVKQIKQGQMDDRVGLLDAGRNGLILAMSLPEGDERNRQIDSSRQNLLLGQAQIAKALERSVEAFQPVSQYALVRFAREMGHSGYLAEKSKEVQEMQDMYDQYLVATKLLAASYVMTGNTQTAEETFRLSEKTIQGIDFSKVETISYQHKGLTDMFYTAPTGYIVAERDECLEEAKQYDYVALEVSGEELLEVLGNGEAKEIQEAGTEE